MAWADEWYPNQRAALIELRGQGPLGYDGSPLPALSALDSIAMVTMVTGPLISALENYTRAENGEGTGAVARRAEDLDADGHVKRSLIDVGVSLLGLGGSPAYDATRQIGAANYLAGVPTDGRPSLRTYGGDAYELWASGEDQLLSFVRDAVAKWQRITNASAAALMTNAADISQPMAGDELRELWSAVSSLCAAMDVLQENPPASTWDRIKGSAEYALDQSTKFVGESAATIAQKVGETAGNLAEGFFEKAGLLAIVVAGIALYLYVPH
jgi:hypothetical protein